MNKVQTTFGNKNTHLLLIVVQTLQGEGDEGV